MNTRYLILGRRSKLLRFFCELELEFDEFTCLTVTVSVPKAHLDDVKKGVKLPVMVYLHGLSDRCSEVRSSY